MKLNCISGDVLGCGQFAPAGISMHRKPLLAYSFVAPGFLRSECNAMARHPQDFAFASALATSVFAIPFLRNLSRTATLDMYAIPVLVVITNARIAPQMYLVGFEFTTYGNGRTFFVDGALFVAENRLPYPLSRSRLRTLCLD